MPDIYEYLDYRAFLRDWFAGMQAATPAYSYRLAAKRIGCNPAFFIRVLQGKKNVSSEMAFRIAGVLKLNRRAIEYFDLLVQSSRADSQAETKFLMERIGAFRNSKIATLDAARYEFFSKWYYSAIREVLEFHPFHGNYTQLARLVVPAIKPSEAKRAVEVLLQLDLIRKEPSGAYHRTEAVVTTGEGWKSQAIVEYQLDTLDLAKEALVRIPPEARNISTLTLCLSDPTYLAIIEKLKAFRRETLELAKNDPEPDKVCQFNFQLFPLTHWETKHAPTDGQKP